MAKTIDEGFRVFLSRLTPSEGETAAAKSHRASIEACLKARFKISRFFRTGSFGNGTSITGYSDVDYFASIPTDNLKQHSASTLRDIKEALDTRFPRTGVHVNSPAVVAPFGGYVSETTEVVPADFMYVTDDKYSVYDIPDRESGWMKSSPEAHNAYVARVDKEKSFRVRPLIRFIKAWKYIRNAEVSSFYLELYVTRYAEKESSIVYSIDVQRILDALWRGGLRDMRDPLGISGLIPACKSESKREDAVSKLLTASVRADKAWEAESKGKIANAFYWWRLLYDDHFPAYG